MEGKPGTKGFLVCLCREHCLQVLDDISTYLHDRESSSLTLGSDVFILLLPKLWRGPSGPLDLWYLLSGLRVPPALRRWVEYWGNYCSLSVPVQPLLASYYYNTVLKFSLLEQIHSIWIMSWIPFGIISLSVAFVCHHFYITCLVDWEFLLTENGSIYSQ